MKTFITALATVAASAIVYDVNAQSLEDGKKLLVYERYVSAEAMLKPLSANSPEANYEYGLSLLGLEKIAEAKSVFSKHTDYMNIAGMARVLYAEGKGSEAYKLLEGIVDGAKKKDWLKYKIAADAITYSKNATQVDEAITWYKTAVERSKNNPEAMMGLADGLLRKNSGTSNGEAVGVLDGLVSNSKFASLAHSRQGDLWMRAKNYAKALESYNSAKAADPQNPLPYGDLAEAYYRSGTYNLAKTNIESYLKYSDKSVWDQMRYGNILYLTKDYEGAQKIYSDLINAGEAKKVPTLHRGLAFTQYHNKDYAGALKSFDNHRGTVTDAKSYTYEDYLYYALVNSAMAKEDAENAAKYNKIADENFVKAIELNTDEDKTKLYHTIIDGYKEAKDWAKVSEWYSKLVIAEPLSAPKDYFNAGYYAYFAKDFKTAKEKLEVFNQKFPDENLGLYWLARTQAAQDADAKTGLAEQPFKNWLNFQMKEGEEREKGDLVFAYQYLALYAYNKNNGRDAVDWSNKLLQIDPGNSTGGQIKKFFEAKGIK